MDPIYFACQLILSRGLGGILAVLCGCIIKKKKPVTHSVQFFFVDVIEYHLWNKVLILACGSRGRVCRGVGELAASSQVRKLRDHICIHTQEAESKLEVGWGCGFSKPAPYSVMSFFKTLPKCSASSPHSATNQGPSVRIRGPVGGALLIQTAITTDNDLEEFLLSRLADKSYLSHPFLWIFVYTGSISPKCFGR